MPFLQLDYKVGHKKLKDVFKLAGNVLRAEIWEDKEGKSRGMATVSFEHSWEAVQAICILSQQNLQNANFNLISQCSAKKFYSRGQMSHVLKVLRDGSV